jgi:hypothetical protein
MTGNDTHIPTLAYLVSVFFITLLNFDVDFLIEAGSFNKTCASKKNKCLIYLCRSALSQHGKHWRFRLYEFKRAEGDLDQSYHLEKEWAANTTQASKTVTSRLWNIANMNLRWQKEKGSLSDPKLANMPYIFDSVDNDVVYFSLYIPIRAGGFSTRIFCWKMFYVALFPFIVSGKKSKIPF